MRAVVLLFVLAGVAGVAPAADEPVSPAGVAEIQRAITAFEAELMKRKADPQQDAAARAIAQQFFEQVQKLRASEAKQEKIFTEAVTEKALANIGGSADRLHQGLADALVDAVGKDRAESVLADKYVPAGQDYTPTAENAFASGAGGALWVFWSQDCPQAELLAGKINVFRSQRPDVRVSDVHMMPLIMWYQQIKYLASVRATLLQVDPARSEEDQFAEKLALRNKAVDQWAGFNAMAKYNRDGGYLMIEDMTAAKAYAVRHLPCFRFISPNGAMHKLEGVSSQLDLSDWVTRCLAWEALNLEEEKRRVLRQ